MEFWRRKKEKEKATAGKKKEKARAREWFLKNGSMFLQKLIADSNGISNPIRMFSSDQISKATNHFDLECSILDHSPYFTWHKGVIQGRSYAIKRYVYPNYKDQFYNDIVISARVSNYSGFLKLMGCCLEFPCPVMVFEDLECRVLNERGSVGCEDALPWNVRLKIAKEVANAITYLHTAFPRIIIHRDIKATNVFLDKNGRAKLTDLSLSVTLPEGKSWIENRVVAGTWGYADPNYWATGIVTASSDVYSFGILMLVLLMGKQSYLDGPDRVWSLPRRLLGYVRDLQERGEPVEFGDDSNDMRTGQMNMFLELALRCSSERNEDRPTMIMVAKEIKLIERSLDCSEDDTPAGPSSQDSNSWEENLED